MGIPPKNIGDGEDRSGPGFVETESGYEAVNESQIYDDDWQDPDIEVYVEGQRAPITRISSGGGRATVRINVPFTFDANIIFIGNLNGSVPAGMILSGADANHNGIPDQLEKAAKQGNVKIPKQVP